MSQPSELFPMIESDAVEPDENQTNTPASSSSESSSSKDSASTSNASESSEATDDLSYEDTTEASEPDAWDSIMEQLRSVYPKASDGILFCVYKLQQNDQLTIVDFRDEARLYGINLGGRALHSAKVLLGLEQPSKRRTKAELKVTPAEPKPAPRTIARAQAATASSLGVEDTLIRAVQQIQDAATLESQKLRTAIQQAMAILQEALDS